MKPVALMVGLAFVVALGGCNKSEENAQGSAPTKTAAKAAGDQTIAKGLASNTSGTRFIAAAKAAGMEPALAGPGPYTVLVPDDNAFAKLEPGSLDGLMSPAAKPKLIRLLRLHVLPGTILSTDIAKAIDAHGGKATLITMEGATLTATRSDNKIVLTDPNGGRAVITRADDKRSNGVVDYIDTVLMPKTSS
jgi:uncharacterized surface protein with fasciclin (FAS1) repeats